MMEIIAATNTRILWYLLSIKKISLEDVFYHLQEKSDAKYMFLITTKDIKTGQEVTANYNLYTYPKTGVGIQMI